MEKVFCSARQTSPEVTFQRLERGPGEVLKQPVLID
jgi:hypothetical protein